MPTYIWALDDRVVSAGSLYSINILHVLQSVRVFGLPYLAPKVVIKVISRPKALDIENEHKCHMQLRK